MGPVILWSRGRVQDMELSSAMGAESVIVAEGGGFDGEDVVGSVGIVPEFLADFDVVIHFLDQSFHQSTGHRQSLASIIRAVHPLAVVGRAVHDRPRPSDG